MITLLIPARLAFVTESCAFSVSVFGPLTGLLARSSASNRACLRDAIISFGSDLTTFTSIDSALSVKTSTESKTPPVVFDKVD